MELEEFPFFWEYGKNFFTLMSLACHDSWACGLTEEEAIARTEDDVSKHDVTYSQDGYQYTITYLMDGTEGNQSDSVFNAQYDPGRDAAQMYLSRNARLNPLENNMDTEAEYLRTETGYACQIYLIYDDPAYTLTKALFDEDSALISFWYYTNDRPESALYESASVPDDSWALDGADFYLLLEGDRLEFYYGEELVYMSEGKN